MSELELKRRLKEIADYSLMCNEGDDVRLAIDAIEELQARVKELEAQRDELLAAAKAVIARWDTPLWKDAEPTAKHINAMREVVTKVEASVGATAEKAK